MKGLKKFLMVASLPFAAAIFAIGIHQSIYYGVQQSYFLFMFSLGFLFLYGLLNREQKANDKAAKVFNTATAEKKAAKSKSVLKKNK